VCHIKKPAYTMHVETVKVHEFNLQREAAAHTSYDLENIQTKTSTAK